MLRRAKDDPDFRRRLWIACARDIVFFIDTFAWTYDPDKEEMRQRPFILYPAQEKILLDMQASVRLRRSHGILKGRRQGASWFGMAFALHTFLFMKESAGIIASRTVDDVDKSGDPRTLFWKIDFMLERLPNWMQPTGWKDHRTNLHFGNPWNGSTIDGVSTQPNMGRGAGATYVWVDEAAAIECMMAALKSVNAISKCRFYVSTPAGAFGGFYVAYNKARYKSRFHWSDFPPFAVGLYTSHDGVLQILDQTYPFPPDYKFILDGKLRSVAYDQWCEEASSPQEVAQERDCEFLGSGWGFFNPARIQKAVQTMAREPYHRLSVSFDRDTAKLIAANEEEKAPLTLWIRLDERDRSVPPGRRYIVACDIAQGNVEGNAPSESVAAIVDVERGEKIGEYVTRSLRPDEFALVAVGLAKWFHGAKMIWDAGGPGHSFGPTVLGLGYFNVWYRRDENREDKPVSKVPGFFIVRGTKEPLLEAYKAALEDGRYINRSEAAISECLCYQRLSNRAIEHQSSLDSEDPTGTGENHGDKVIADALAWWVLREEDPPEPEPEEPDTVMFSRKWRDEKAKNRNRHTGHLMPTNDKW